MNTDFISGVVVIPTTTKTVRLESLLAGIFLPSGSGIGTPTPEPSGITNIRIGSITPASIYAGSTQVQSIYLGSTLVWQI